MTQDSIEIFTDGACRGNPGPGGWGAVLRWRGTEKRLHGGERQTTNNRMELMAAIRALEALKRPSSVVLTTDSNYVRQGITEWLPRWKQRKWRTAAGKSVKNVDLWQRLEVVAGEHSVEWRWIKGHSGHAGNEAADELANRGVDEIQGRHSECGK